MAAKPTEYSNLERRAVIRFFQAEGVKTSEIYSRMKAQYGCNCLSKSSCYKWAKAFKEGRVKIQDEERSGRPVEVSVMFEQYIVRYSLQIYYIPVSTLNVTAH